MLAGTPEQIVRQMQDLAFRPRDASLDDYITWLAGESQRLFGVALTITGTTPAARAASLLEQLLTAGFATRC